MNQQMKILKEIAQVTDRDDFYNRAKELGEIAWQAFGPRHRNQMTSLENIANSTLKVTDVLDYIKKQVAKDARDDTQQTWRKNNFGEQLKNCIEQCLRARRREICGILDSVEENSSEGQRIYLNLIREFVSQLVVHYEYHEYQMTVGGQRDGSDN